MPEYSRIFRRSIPHLAAIWVSIACIGYGMALKQHAMEVQAKVGDQMSFFNPSGAPLVARIESSNASPSRESAIEFRLENDPRKFLLPREFVQDLSLWQDANQALKPGAKVRVQVAQDDSTLTELSINPDTVFQKTIVSRFHAQSGAGSWIAGYETRGSLFVVLGALLTPAVFLSLRWWRRRRTGVDQA